MKKDDLEVFLFIMCIVQGIYNLCNAGANAYTMSGPHHFLGFVIGFGLTVGWGILAALFITLPKG